MCSIDHCCLGNASMLHVKYTIYFFEGKLSGEMCWFDIIMVDAYLLVLVFSFRVFQCKMTQVFATEHVVIMYQLISNSGQHNTCYFLVSDDF